MQSRKQDCPMVLTLLSVMSIEVSTVLPLKALAASSVTSYLPPAYSSAVRQHQRAAVRFAVGQGQLAVGRFGWQAVHLVLDTVDRDGVTNGRAGFRLRCLRLRLQGKDLRGGGAPAPGRGPQRSRAVLCSVSGTSGAAVAAGAACSGVAAWTTAGCSVVAKAGTGSMPAAIESDSSSAIGLVKPDLRFTKSTPFLLQGGGAPHSGTDCGHGPPSSLYPNDPQHIGSIRYALKLIISGLCPARNHTAVIFV